jgi:hypothetical protein
MAALDARLAELAQLKPNWDSYGGKPPTKEALAVAERLTFTPTSDGGILVELSVPDTWAELLITPEGHIDDCSWGPQ